PPARLLHHDMSGVYPRLEGGTAHGVPNSAGVEFFPVGPPLTWWTCTGDCHECCAARGVQRIRRRRPGAHQAGGRRLSDRPGGADRVLRAGTRGAASGALAARQVRPVLPHAPLRGGRAALRRGAGRAHRRRRGRDRRAPAGNDRDGARGRDPRDRGRAGSGRARPREPDLRARRFPRRGLLGAPLHARQPDRRRLHLLPAVPASTARALRTEPAALAGLLLTGLLLTHRSAGSLPCEAGFRHVAARYCCFSSVYVVVCPCARSLSVTSTVLPSFAAARRISSTTLP